MMMTMLVKNRVVVSGVRHEQVRAVVERGVRWMSSRPRPIALSFGGSGLMMLYQFGAASAMSNDGKFMERVVRCHGTSGGAIAGAMLMACPDRLEDGLEFFASGKWLNEASPGDLLAPHRTLLTRAIRELELSTEAKTLRHRFVAHVTEFRNGARNVGIDDFADDDEVVDAISASCCLSPSGSVFRDRRYWDGGFTDPLPSDPSLPTISVSILAGEHVDVCPGKKTRPLGDVERLPRAESGQGTIKTPRYLGPPFLRYPITPRNARALVETVVLTPQRARTRFEQGRQDALAFLERYWRGSGRHHDDEQGHMRMTDDDDYSFSASSSRVGTY